MSLFSFKKKPTISFVFDIRDTTITIAVTKFKETDKPEIILCKSFKILVEDMKDHAKYLASMISTLDTSILDIRRSLIQAGNFEKIGKYHFFIGSPWSVSQAKTIRILKDRPFDINNQFLEKIFVGEESASAKQIEDGSEDKNWHVLEEKIIQSKLGGYKVENIFGKKTTDLEVELFVSFIPYELQNKINSFIDQKVGRKIVRQTNSSILASYTCLRDLFPMKNNFIYVDIGSFLTDVYVVRDDIVSSIISFPYGERDIIKSTAIKVKVSDDVLASTINIHRDGNHDAEAKKHFVQSLEDGIKIWSDKLAEAVSKVCTEITVPEDIYIIANSGTVDFLVNEIGAKNDSVLKILGTEMKFEIVREDMISDFITNGRTSPNEPYVKMDLVFLDAMMKGN